MDSAVSDAVDYRDWASSSFPVRRQTTTVSALETAFPSPPCCSDGDLTFSNRKGGHDVRGKRGRLEGDHLRAAAGGEEHGPTALGGPDPVPKRRKDAHQAGGGARAYNRSDRRPRGMKITGLALSGLPMRKAGGAHRVCGKERALAHPGVCPQP